MVSLVAHIEKFLLELGKGFMFVGTQQRVMLGNEHYYVDNEDGDNDPIGIIMCTDKDNVSVEYSLGGYENKIFASKYTLVLPNKEKLIEQVNKVIDGFNKKK